MLDDPGTRLASPPDVVVGDLDRHVRHFPVRPGRDRPTYRTGVRALVIANADDADPGFVGHHLRSKGYAFTECHRERPSEWPELDGTDLVLLLGSEWSVYWPRVADSVDAECALVKSAHEQGIPVLGICFGAQIVAHALGGSVERAARPEVGWHRIDSDVPDTLATGPWLQWHFDVCRIPQTFTELARSESGPQAFTAKRTLATQFHPEANESMLARWTAGSPDELARLGLSADGVMADTRRFVSQSRPAAERLVDWFCDAIANS
ncbi:MAG: aminotransferase [Acidimicrobiales bacterium mtb01]|nr:type 1 glutamine amidotransferase [Actinomycetota bacterium]TEX48457.1 MAG: aminotransferase [Acidimicrobiales bacterium mtb01]